MFRQGRRYGSGQILPFGRLQKAKNPPGGGLLIKYQDINYQVLVLHLFRLILMAIVFKNDFCLAIKDQSQQSSSQ
ncbi:hypothetical protein D7N50_25120 [Salmonella enterica subsp. enterica serovar Abony]|nr:hypothetical protein [Salmonella enterica subsp. enterica serovar Abony]